MKKLGMIFVAGIGWVSASAMAAVDPSVTTAITGAGTDAQTVASAVFVVLVGIFAVKLMRKGL